MNILAAQEVKRRGVAAVDDLIGKGPVHILKNNRPRYVIMKEDEYAILMTDLAEARLAASEADLKAGRVHRGTANKLFAELERR
jgi:PHD/YefM family antitoxin component YafN of YafNO toxin-antitoxin module